jgi:nucleotide-binding universal stress UspA family protein
MVSDVWLEERREDERLLAARVEAITGFLSSSPVSADVSGEYCELVMADDVIGRRARYCDLTVIGPELLEGATLKEKAVEGVLFSAGGPLLLMPQGAAFNLRPRRVMVAWDARMEAARAVRDARGLLAGAEEVILTLVDPVEGEGAHGAEPGADAAAYLSRHGARVRVDRIPGKGRDVAEVLGGHAVDCGADMMVMGAYGHSRLRERIFGGVTRSFLDRPPLPVFMAR